MGISLRVPGPLNNPSIIRDCAIRNFWKDGPTGIGILFAATNLNDWRIEGNTFVNTKQPIYLNTLRNLTITENSMTRFASGINIDPTQVIYNLEISHNTLNADWGTPVPALADVIRGISLSANSNAGEPDRNWVITNNLINGVTEGIRVRSGAGTTSLAGVTVRDNSITATRCGSSIIPSCQRAAVLNDSPETLDATNNWWGRPTGPEFGVRGPGAVIIEPWIVSYTLDTPCLGFCPIDVVTGNSTLPVIVSVTADPTTIAAGESFSVTVTLQDAILNAYLDVTAALAGRALRNTGVTCQPVGPFTGTTVTTTCTAGAGALDGTYVLEAVVTTPGNRGSAVDTSASVVVQNGVDCINPASVLLVPQQALTKTNDQLPLLATVLDANGDPVPDGLPVTFTISFVQHYPADAYPSNSYGYRLTDPPVVSVQTADANGVGQALLVLSESLPGQASVVASVTDCSGSKVSSNASTVTFTSGELDCHDKPPAPYGNGGDAPAPAPYSSDAPAEGEGPYGTGLGPQEGPSYRGAQEEQQPSYRQQPEREHRYSYEERDHYPGERPGEVGEYVGGGRRRRHGHQA